MKKYKKLIPVLIVIILFIIVKVMSISAPYRGCVFKSNSIKQIFINGIIVKKFKDESDHNMKKITILNKNNDFNIAVQGDQSGLYDFINIGDSIYKEKNSMEATIVRDSVKKAFIIDFGCEKIKR